MELGLRAGRGARPGEGGMRCAWGGQLAALAMRATRGVLGRPLGHGCRACSREWRRARVKGRRTCTQGLLRSHSRDQKRAYILRLDIQKFKRSKKLVL
jgi:hypothetical protein